jgi:predicted nucleic acid-binding protein
MNSGTPSRIEAVFDASPLVFLDLLDYAPLLPSLYRVLIPPQVAAELTARPGAPGSDIPQHAWVELRRPSDETLTQVRNDLLADPGEEEVVALALDLTRTGGTPTLAVLDDLKARKYAQSVGLPLVGTLGILLRLHRLGHTDRTFEDDLARLERGGMRLTPALKRELLARAERDR